MDAAQTAKLASGNFGLLYDKGGWKTSYLGRMKLEILTLCGSAEAIGGAITIKDATDRIYFNKSSSVISPCCIVYRLRFDPIEIGNHTIKIVKQKQMNAKPTCAALERYNPAQSELRRF